LLQDVTKFVISLRPCSSVHVQALDDGYQKKLQPIIPIQKKTTTDGTPKGKDIITT
jgi:hypothetical protein